MEDYIDLGFKLDLYSIYELEYIYWYQNEVIYHSIIKAFHYFQEIQKTTKKSECEIFWRILVLVLLDQHLRIFANRCKQKNDNATNLLCVKDKV